MMRYCIGFILLSVSSVAQTTIETLPLIEQFGVSHREQPVRWTLADKTLNPKLSTHRIISTDGVERAWQRLTNGEIVIKSRLPMSMKPLRCALSGAGGDHVTTITGACFTPDTQDSQNLALGDPVTFDSSGSVPAELAGCTATAPCYIVAMTGGSPIDVKVSATQGGSAITGISSGSGNHQLIRLGFIQDPADGTGDTLYGRHLYQNGDPFTPSTTGALPTGMSCDPCFVRDRTAWTFKVASTLGGAAQNLTAGTGSGYHTATTDWSLRLQSGTTTTVTATNPVTVAVNGANYDIGSALGGLRIPTTAGWTSPLAPIQKVKLRDGTSAGPSGTNKMYETLNGSTEHTGLSSYNLRFLESGPIYTKVRAEYTTSRPEYRGGYATISSSDSGADTITVAGPGTPCDLWNQAGASGYFHASSNFGPFTTSNVYTFSLVSGCTFQVLLAGTPQNITTDLTGNTFEQIISLAGAGFIYNDIEFFSNQESAIVTDYGNTKFQYYVNLKSTIDPTNIKLSSHSSSGIDCIYQQFGAVASATLSGGTLTVTTTLPQYMSSGRTARVSGMTGITGTAEGSITSTGADTFTVACGGCSGTSATGGTYFGNFQQEKEGDGSMTISSAVAKNVSVVGAGTCNSSTFPRMIPWYYVVQNGSNFQTFYNSAASAGANVAGIARGGASQLIWALNVGPGPYSDPAHFADGNAASSGFTDYMDFSAPNSTVGTPARHQWVLHFGGTKAGVSNDTYWWARSDTLMEANSLTGVNLTEIVQSVPVWGTSVGNQFMSDAAIAAVAAKVQDGTIAPSCGSNSCYYDQLIASSSSTEMNLTTEMWRQNTSRASELAASYVQAYLQRIMTGFVSQGGVWQTPFQYSYLASTATTRFGLAVSAINDPNVSAATILSAKASIAVLGRMLWNDNIAPFTAANTGDSIGLPNMPQQWLADQTIMTVALKDHPYMATKFPTAKARALGFYNVCVNGYGAPGDSIGYLSTLCGPALFAFMSLKNKGEISFADYPNWSKLGTFLYQFHTPPDPQYNNNIKHISIGDASPVPTELLGMLATALDGTDNDQRDRLMGAWLEQNSSTALSHKGFFANSAAAIDIRIAGTTPTRTSYIAPGHSAMFRFGTGNNENWFTTVNGTFLADHAIGAYGSTSGYFQKSPWSTPFSGYYTPPSGGAYAQSRAMPTSSLASGSWNSDSPSVNLPGNIYGAIAVNEFSATGNCGYTSATYAGTGWTRKIFMCAPNSAKPLVRIVDSFSNGASNVVSWLQRAGANAVTNPASASCTPVARVGESTENPTTLPSTGTGNCAFTFAAGLNRTIWTGASWPAAPGGGIDWDVFTTASGCESVIGNWGTVYPSSGREYVEFNAANSRAYDQIQHMWRIMCASGATIDNRVYPFQKGATPTRAITSQSCGAENIDTTSGTQTSCDSDDKFQWTNGTAKMLRSFGTGSQTYSNMTVSGCPTEIYYTSATSITVTAGSTTACTGTIDLSAVGGNWFADQPMGNPSTNVFTFHLPTAAQPTMFSVGFSTTSGDRRSFPITFARATGTVRVKFGGSGSEYVGSASCSGTCTVNVLSPTGSQSLYWEYDDGAGVVAPSGDPVTINVN